MPLDLQTWDGAQTFVTGVLKFFRENFERDGFLVPVAFLWITKNIETGTPHPEPVLIVVALDFEDKEGSFYRLKELAVEGGAIVSVFASESRKVEAPVEEQDAVLQYMSERGTLEGHPACKELLFVTMEHRPSNKTQGWEAVIERSGGASILGDFISIGVDRLGMLEGQAVNILPIDMKTAS